MTDYITETYLREEALVLTHDSGNSLSLPGRRDNRNVSVRGGGTITWSLLVFKNQEAEMGPGPAVT